MLGRLIVRGQFLTKPIYTNYTSTRKIKGGYGFPRIFSSCHVLNLSGKIECEHYHAEAETNGGSDFKYKRSIRKGDTISLKDLLFTNNRDYVIKNNNQYVKAEQLKDKIRYLFIL
ncbi:hypothetical protein POM88_024508 [Heracleum sosnowskyi]|uniref:Uncharacterized protein n=1 Tax=Heracleum sosnowskyi TaxID=360622 RepID=A0AAD8MMC8_9APIA|nr:hypothetical protein POM88_024508 [Heracleum sosnowskyi]